MKTISLIACCSKKLQGIYPAEQLYQSDLFKKSFAYAKKLKPTAIYILSAKYGLVELNQELETYNVTLNDCSATDNKNWAQSVLKSLSEKTDLKNDKFIYLAGNNYRKNLLKHTPNNEIPMNGLKIGEQLQWLSNNLR